MHLAAAVLGLAELQARAHEFEILYFFLFYLSSPKEREAIFTRVAIHLPHPPSGGLTDPSSAK